MRDDDFWNRDYRRHPIGGRNFWDDHAASMELLKQGNQMLAQQIVDGLGCLWRRLRRPVVTQSNRTVRIVFGGRTGSRSPDGVP